MESTLRESLNDFYSYRYHHTLNRRKIFFFFFWCLFQFTVVGVIGYRIQTVPAPVTMVTTQSIEVKFVHVIIPYRITVETHVRVKKWCTLRVIICPNVNVSCFSLLKYVFICVAFSVPSVAALKKVLPTTPEVWLMVPKRLKHVRIGFTTRLWWISH